MFYSHEKEKKWRINKKIWKKKKEKKRQSETKTTHTNYKRDKTWLAERWWKERWKHRQIDFFNFDVHLTSILTRDVFSWTHLCVFGHRSLDPRGTLFLFFLPLLPLSLKSITLFSFVFAHLYINPTNSILWIKHSLVIITMRILHFHPSNKYSSRSWETKRELVPLRTYILYTYTYPLLRNFVGGRNGTTRALLYFLLN